MKPHKVSSRAKLALVLYGDPVCVLLSARMRERTWRTCRDPRHAKRAQGAPLIAFGGGDEGNFAIRVER